MQNRSLVPIMWGENLDLFIIVDQKYIDDGTFGSLLKHVNILLLKFPFCSPNSAKI